jgi:error-prone DNA polymerase
MAGVVRAHTAAKEHEIKLLIGSQFKVQCDAPFTLVVLACNLDGYGNLCEFITKQRRSAPKGTYRLAIDDIDPDELRDCVVIASPERSSTPAQLEAVRDGC